MIRKEKRHVAKRKASGRQAEGMPQELEQAIPYLLSQVLTKRSWKLRLLPSRISKVKWGLLDRECWVVKRFFGLFWPVRVSWEGYQHTPSHVDVYYRWFWRGLAKESFGRLVGRGVNVDFHKRSFCSYKKEAKGEDKREGGSSKIKQEVKDMIQKSFNQVDVVSFFPEDSFPEKEERREESD